MRIGARAETKVERHMEAGAEAALVPVLVSMTTLPEKNILLNHQPAGEEESVDAVSLMAFLAA